MPSQPINYKFSFNPKLSEKVEIFVNKNFNLEINLVKIENNKISATIKFTTNSKKELFAIHNFLLEIHEITGNRKKGKVKKPKICITLKGAVNRGFYFNYLLGSDLCQILKKSNVEFSVAKIKKNGFHYLDTCPIWITEEDLGCVKDIVKNSIYGKNYHVAIISRNVIQE